MKNQGREKRNVPEFKPPEPQFIESSRSTFSPTEIEIFQSSENIPLKLLKKNQKSYVNELNFPSKSQLQQIQYGSFTSLHLYSIKLPPSLTVILPEAFKKCNDLKQIEFCKNEENKCSVYSICDEAFKETVINSIVIPETVEEIGCSCFPKCLEKIELENGCENLKKIGENAFSFTQIASFNLPSNISPFVNAKNVFFRCKKLKEINFDRFISKNKTTIDETEEELNERKNKKIIFNHSIQKVENNEFTRYEITGYLAKSLLLSQTRIEKLEIVSSNLNYFYFFNTPKLTSIEIPKNENAKYVKVNGCLYTNNMKKLIVAERNIKSHDVLPTCQIISNYAFNVKSLEKVSFDKNSELKEISFLSFYDSQIKEINLPNSVDLISYGAFYKCQKLESINIPNLMKSIDFFTFSYTGITEIFIPKSIVKIQFGSFFCCFNLKSVLFEKESNLIEIDDFAFAYTKIESILIPKSVRRIGSYCFLNCEKMNSIIFEDGSNIQKIEYTAFRNTQIEYDKIEQNIEFYIIKSKGRYNKVECNTFIRPYFNGIISEISIPPSVEEIGFHAFFDCTNLSKVEIIDLSKSKLSKICNGAFYNCASLIAFELPKSVNYIDSDSFKNCINYAPDINLSSKNKIVICKSAFENSGVVSFNSKSREIYVDDFAFKNCLNMIFFKTNALIKCEIGESAFNNCNSLTEVKLNPEVYLVKIGKSCFMNSSIQKIIIPKKLEIISESCFKLCKKLNEVIIDETSKIQKFGSEAFLESGIQKIFIPSKTYIIDKRCFENCQKLKELTFSEDLNHCILQEYAFYNSGIEKLHISSAINKIKYGCFENCSNLKNVTIEDYGISQIKDNVFKSTGIESIVFPEYIDSIGNFSFANCSKLKEVTYENKYEDVKNSLTSFLGCNQIESITVNRIAIDQFFMKKKQFDKEYINAFFINGCEMVHLCYHHNFFKIILYDKEFKLENNFDENIPNARFLDKVYYSLNMDEILTCDLQIESVKISKLTKYIRSKAFTYSSLKKVDFEVGSQINTIENSSFKNLLIEEISIPDSVSIIDDFAFSNCIKLKQIKISVDSKLKRIGCNAFESCIFESFVFPSTLTDVDDSAFFKCINLKKVENHSNQITFGYQSFYKTPIESIQFPPIVTFGDSSFRHCTNLKKLSFLKDPEKIIFGVDSFSSSGLETIKLNCNVDIQEYAFAFCPNLKQVQIKGDNNTCIHDPFYCSKVNQIYFEVSVDIYDEYFNQNIFLSDIENKISNSYVERLYLKLRIFHKIKKNRYVASFQNIYDNTIYMNHNCIIVDDKLCYANLIDNTSLFFKEDIESSKVTIRNNEMINISDNAKKLNFQYSPHIKKIKWNKKNELNDFNMERFFAYYNLTEILIPKKITRIHPRLFEHCHYLKQVIFENESELTEIGEFSFSNTRIEKISLPDSVQIIKQSAFANNKYLKSVDFNGEIIDDNAFSSTGITQFNLSNQTKIIGSNAFQYCHDLTKFTIDIDNSNIAEIGQYAFADSSIVEINIPVKLKTIKNFTFNNCKFLKEVKFSSESTLDEIEDYSFSGDIKLEKMNIPKTISKLSHTAFINTPSLNSIMRESNIKFHVMENNEVYYKVGINQFLIFVPRNLKKFDVPQNCSVIASGAFCGPNIEQVKLLDISLNCIEKCGFSHSTKLKKIFIPKSIKKIEEEAFIDCQNLEIVEFDHLCQLVELPKFCFAFSGLKKINLPESIQIINDSCFYFCTNLENVDLFNTNVKYIGNSAFSETGIREIVFPSTLKYIDSQAFERMKSLMIVDFTNCFKIKDDLHDVYNKNKRAKSFVRLNKKMRTKSNKKTPKTSKQFSQTPKPKHPKIIKPFQSRILSPRKSPLINVQSSTNCLLTPRHELIKSDENKKIENVCNVHYSAFHDSSVKIFKFNLKKYTWFNFFDKCSQIIEYSVNSDIQIFLKKMPKEKPNSGLIGPFYKVMDVVWKNEDLILWKKNKPETLSIFNFLNLSKLRIIQNIPDIPQSSFQYTNIREVTISSSTKKIGISAFKYCINLEKVTFVKNSSLKIIESFAFYQCKKLKTISIPNGVKIIQYRCFAFSGLQKIVLPNSIKAIYSMAFFNCNQLKQIELNEGLNRIGYSAFANNESLKSINIPNSLKIIERCAFQNCINLKEVNTKEATNLTMIYNEAFENTQIEELKLSPMTEVLFEPKNVPKLNKITFYNKEKLKHFKQFDDGTIYYILNEEEINKKNDDKLISNISSFSINDSNLAEFEDFYVNLVENQSRQYKLVFAPKNIKQLKIQENCDTINDYVLDGMKNLETIEYMKGKCNLIRYIINSYNNGIDYAINIKVLGYISFIERSAFANFKGIQTIEFSENTNLFIIPRFAFKDCTNLKEITLPISCTIIKSGAFKNCINLQSININAHNEHSIRKNGIEIIEEEAFFNCSSIQSISISPFIQIIDSKAFMNCTNLSEFTFVSKDEYEKVDELICLITIGDSAFKNCTSLKSFKIRKNCRNIGKSIFMNCTSLKTVLIETESKSLKIPYHLFYNCTSMKKFNLVSDYFISFIDIGFESFMNCSSLTEFTIDYSNDEEKRESDSRIKDMQIIRRGAFRNCKSLKKVRIFCGRIDQIDMNAFSECGSLEKVEINSKQKMNRLLQNLNRNAFVNSNENLKIELFYNKEEFRSLNLNEIKIKREFEKALVKEKLSFLNKSFLNSDEQDNTANSNKLICLFQDRNDLVGPRFIYEYETKMKITIKTKTMPSIFDNVSDYQTEYYYMPVSRPPLNI